MKTPKACRCGKCVMERKWRDIIRLWLRDRDALAATLDKPSPDTEELARPAKDAVHQGLFEAGWRHGAVASEPPAGLDELRALSDAATPGPWAWRGYTDGAIELRTVGHGGQRVISAMRGDPCVVELDGDLGITLTRTACQSCRHEWAKPHDAFTDRDTPCEKDENLGTLYLLDQDAGFIRPINKWAVKEVTYRNDVTRVDHPDAAFIVAAVNYVRALVVKDGEER